MTLYSSHVDMSVVQANYPEKNHTFLHLYLLQKVVVGCATVKIAVANALHK